MSVADRWGVSVAPDEREGSDLPEFDVERAKKAGAVVMYARHVPIHKIARHYNVHRTTVWRWLQRVELEDGERALSIA